MFDLKLRLNYHPEFLYDGWKPHHYVQVFRDDWKHDDEISRLPDDVKWFFVDLLLIEAKQGYLMKLDLDFGESSKRSTPVDQADFSEIYRSSLKRTSDDLAKNLSKRLNKDPRKVRRQFTPISSQYFVLSRGYVISGLLESHRKKNRSERERKRNHKENPIPFPTDEVCILYVKDKDKTPPNPTGVGDRGGGEESQKSPEEKSPSAQGVPPPNRLLPRESKTNPRAVGANSRANGTNPRNLKSNPRVQDPDAELAWKLFEELADESEKIESPGGYVRELRKTYDHPDETNFTWWKNREEHVDRKRKRELLKQARSFVGQEFRGVTIEENGFESPKGADHGFVNFSSLSTEKLEEFINEMTLANTGQNLNGAVKA